MASTSSTVAATDRPARHPGLLIAVAFTPPTAWAVHLGLTYWFVPVSCRLGTTLPIHLATVGCLVASIGAGLAGRRFGRHQPAVAWRELIAALGTDRRRAVTLRLLPTLAVVFSAYFTFVIVVTWLLAVIVDPCA